jgi:putative transposase
MSFRSPQLTLVAFPLNQHRMAAGLPMTRGDEVVDFIDGLSATTEIAVQRLVGWLGLSRGKYYAWRGRYGTANEHNGKIPP